MANIERTLVLIKPDAVQRELVGEVVARFERKGLKIVAMKLMHLEEEVVTEHYSHLKEKPFFPALVQFMMQTPTAGLILEGLDAVETVRTMVGATNPRVADVGTIRSDLSMNVPSNIVHASESIAAAADEIKRFFREDEVFSYEKLTDIYHFGEGV